MTTQREPARAPERTEADSGQESVPGVDCFGNCRGEVAAAAWALDRIFRPLERREEAVHGYR